ncbi:hypothetical protein Rmet_6657 (plasmid) [Cupriavidus metallidurans CH34]|uniref:Uncharacterized protein n=1 Tax=Cupriavidus metallidurans (strain ATCC 43123 / DSM 2839 / NBRC 102507 / CH34) TaxID=266264 RepID=D3DY87_CUPMC|nr:hypothetical protein Rmet_6657 [Cupriavidus metallidurans CH34]
MGAAQLWSFVLPPTSIEPKFKVERGRQKPKHPEADFGTGH